MGSENRARDVVLSYVKALDRQDFSSAKEHLADNVRVRGPSGEAFRSASEFINMLQTQRGRYDLKKDFVDGNDVCLLYDFVTPKLRAFFCSWYQVKDGKIDSIQTIFDTKAFAQ